jgi:hypothetical protein
MEEFRLGDPAAHHTRRLAGHLTSNLTSRL